MVAGVDNIANFDQLNVTRERAFCAVVPAAREEACYTRIGLEIRARTQDEQGTKLGHRPTSFHVSGRSGSGSGEFFTILWPALALSDQTFSRLAAPPPEIAAATAQPRE